jgi:hypothetical protein
MRVPADKTCHTLTPRLVKGGLLPGDQAVLGRILKSAD